jgi:putative ABC transport system ATP-binding protein
MLEAKNITKIYPDEGGGTKALKDITFKINAGEFVSIMGPSGSGKSTLLHVISFLDRPTGGSYSFNGRKMEELSDEELAHIRNEEMGFVFQSFNLLPHASVYENVGLPLLYSKHPSKERPALIKKAIDSVGLNEKTAVEAGKLSGGQKQRVAIARALVNNPKVIFADEPTGNLDSQSGKAIMDILKKLHSEGHTIILVTHETYTARYGDRLIFIQDGLVKRDEPIQKDGEEDFMK